jgi:predicted enzyme related to lactoylglutathione lyase
MSNGDVFQIEIRVRDLAEAMHFYRTAFAWGVYQSTAGYALIDTGTMPIASLLQDSRLPLGVCPHVIVPDCAATAARAKELGGKLLITRSVVEGSGAYTGTLDPWGNELFFWEPFAEGRPKPKHEAVNPFVFMEIATPNLAKAKAYYTDLLGWEFWDVTFAPSYAVAEGRGLKRGIGLLGGDAAATGIITFINVANLEVSQTTIENVGGKVVVPPTAFLDGGRYMIISDPSGNRLGVVESAR